MKMKHQRWPEMPLTWGTSGTHVAMVTKLLSLYCGAHVESNLTGSKDLNISDTN